MLHVETVAGKGRAIFTDSPIANGSIALVDPIAVLGNEGEDLELLQRFTYAMEVGVCIALGLGSLINHDDNPNLDYAVDAAAQTITYTALRDIAAGDELTIDYLWDSYPWKSGMER